jgi:serralysin
MPTLGPVRYVAGASGPTTSRITDLGIVTLADGTDILYATTRFDGAITAWSLAGTGLARIDSAAHGRADRAGALAELGFLTTTDGPALLTGGGASGGIVLRQIGADGSLGPARALGTASAIRGDLIDSETIALSNGNTVVYAGTGSNSGLIRAYFRPDGTLINAFRQGDTATTYAERVTALTQARVGDVTYVIGASDISGGMTSWAVAPLSGALTAADSLDAAQGLWIRSPTALETATVAGQTYLVLAAAGTGSLSVIHLGADGRLTPVTHLLDDQDSRFAGVTAIEVVAHAGLTYVIAGGSDDGISVWLLLPGGGLVAEAHLADATGTGLANVSAIAARSSGTGIDIIVASATETGLTRLRFETGPEGSTLTAPAAGGTLTGGAGRDLVQGGAAADRLAGGGGDDILTDGGGADRLTGGGGADLFVLSADDQTDTITDFTPGEDRLNLQAWPMLRSLYQLTLTPTATGLRIAYGDEVLILISADGRPIPVAGLTTAGIIGGTSIPQDPRPGFAGPGRPAPPLPERDDTPPPRARPTPVDPLPEPVDPWPFPWNDGEAPAPRSGTIRGTPGNDILRGDAGGNVIKGLAGRDSLYGGGGRDVIQGGGGRDFLDGGKDNDRLQGGPGNDTLIGGEGRDRLSGNGGNDRLEGWNGNDTLKGDAGRDLLFGMAGRDNLAGGRGNDRMSGGAGRDRLEGQDGQDSLGGLDGNDRLSGGAGDDRLSGGADNDRLSGDKGNDILTGGSGADVFVFAAGRDRITDMGRTDRILLDDRLWSGALTADQVIDRFAEIRRGDTVLNFGDGNSLIISDIRDPDWLAGRIDLI